MNGISTADTEREADRIYRAIFKAPAPGTLGARFRLAADRLNERMDPEELAGHYRIIREAGDLESLEMAGRLTGSLASLSTRFLIMVHLAETYPENQRFYINDRPGAVRAWWAIGAGGLASVFKLLKGLLLLKRYRHA